LPSKITLDDAIKEQARGGGITIDDALSQREAEMRPGGRLDVRAGEELVKGQGLPGSPDYRPPAVAPRVEPAEKANFGAAFKQNMVEDVPTKRRLIAESLFPGDPKGIERIGFIDDSPVYVDDEGKLRKVSSGPAAFGAAAVANAPEIAGATIGSGAGVIGATLGATGARGLKRAAAGLIFDEPQTISGNLADVATEGAVTLGAGVIGKGLGKVLDRGKTVDFAPTSRTAAEQTVQRVKKTTGIDLDLAQASGDRKLIALRAYAARYPGKSAELIQAADELAEGQFEKASQRVLDMIATSKPSEIVGKEGINAAEMVIAAAKSKRDAAVAPYYEAAGKVALSEEVVSAISRDPLIARAAKRVASDPVYQRKLEGVPPGSVAYWQQVKRNLDASYSKSMTAGDNTAAREYADASKQLNEKLGAASPEYAQANEFFAKSTKDIVEPLENSVIGVIAKIKDPNAATVAAKLFSDPNLSPQALAEARKLISAKNPEAWDGLVRQWMGQKLNQAFKETQTASVTNPAGKFRQAVFGTPADRQKAAVMLPGGAVKDFEDLMFAAEKLASTPIAGSNTMRDTEIKDQLKGTGAVIFRWLTSPRKAVVDAAEQRALEQGTVAITEALIDPAKRSQLRRVVKMKPSTRQAMLLTSIISGQAAEVAAEDVPDQLPPSLGRRGR
jgi:hypothetical protein